jgi:subtilisin family serine protease
MATTRKKRPRKASGRSEEKAAAPQPAMEEPTFGGGTQKRLDHIPGQYFVRVHPDSLRPYVPARTRAPAGAARLAFTAATAAAVPESLGEPLDFLRQSAGLKSLRPLFAEAGRKRVSSAKVSGRQRDRLALAASVLTEDDDDLAGIAIAELDPKATAASLKRVASAGAVDFIEPVPARWLAATVDPMRNVQWGLRAIRWFDARRPDASEVTVGVMDTGVDAGHPDFAGVPMKYDHPGTRAADIVGHGTHVSGIIAAATNNGVGIAGVATCALHNWKIFGDTPIQGDFYVDADMFADALRAAANSGLRALNLSIGGTASSRTEQILIRRLVDRGVVVVAAMGNDFLHGNPTEYPAAYDNVLAVGAIAENRERSSFSNTGAHIGICAPGSHILSTLPRRPSTHRTEKMYASWSGTSMATPHVAAAAALVAARHPGKSGAEIAEHLRKNAATLPAMRGRNRTQEYGDGLLDLKAALR